MFVPGDGAGRSRSGRRRPSGASRRVDRLHGCLDAVARRGDVIALDSGPAMLFADALAEESQRLSPQATKEDQSAAAARLWELALNLHHSQP
jgi:hypothetical protein